MEAIELGAIANNFKISPINKISILRTLDNANQIVFGERAYERNLDSEDIGNVFDGMKLLLGFLGLRLHGKVGEQPHLKGQGGKIVCAIEFLLDNG